MYRAVVLIAALIAFTSGQTTEVSRCSVHQGELPLNVYIHGCETPPCLLPQLQNVVVDIVFRAPRTIRSMRTLASAFLILNIPLPYDLGENSATCNFLQNSFCPILEGEVVQYRLLMFIESFMSVGIQVPIEFRVMDENNVPILCLRAVIRIVDPVQQLNGGNSTLLITEQ